MVTPAKPAGAVKLTVALPLPATAVTPVGAVVTPDTVIETVGLRDRLSHRQRRVLEAVPVRRAADDFSIAGTAGVSPLEVRGTLVRLESAGHVQREGTGWRLADRDPADPDAPCLDWTG